MTRSNPESYWDWVLVHGLKYTHERPPSVEQFTTEMHDANRL